MAARNIILLAVSRSGHTFVRENMVSWTTYQENVHIFNFESVNPSRYASALKAKAARGNIDLSVPTMHVIHTRDLLNWWASLLTYRAKNHMDISDTMNNEMMSIWNGLTREGFGLDNMFENKHLCVYDEFVTSREHRQALCNAIGGVYDEKLLNHVPPAGGGSSFDGWEYQDNGNAMATDLRYQQVQDTILGDWFQWTLAKNLPVMRTYDECFQPVGDKRIQFDRIYDSKYANQKGNLKGTAKPTKAMKMLSTFTKAAME